MIRLDLRICPNTNNIWFKNIISIVAVYKTHISELIKFLQFNNIIVSEYTNKYWLKMYDITNKFILSIDETKVILTSVIENFSKYILCQCGNSYTSMITNNKPKRYCVNCNLFYEFTQNSIECKMRNTLVKKTFMVA